MTGLTRRNWLLATAFAIVAAPLARKGWIWRKRRELPATPWIGHC